VLETAFGFVAGLDQFGSGIANLFNGDDYIPTSAVQYTSGMVRDDLKDTGFKLPDWMGGASLGQAAYDGVTTIANMAPSILASTVVGTINPAAGAAVGNVLMGASATGNAYQEALNLGYDKGQARAYSTLVGASETGLQYLMGGIGKLGSKISGKAAASLASKFDNAFARLAVKYGTNMLQEGAEEYLQEILTPVFKNLALKTDEEVNLITEDAIYSFLLGAVTSGVMEGPGTTAQAVQMLPFLKSNRDAVKTYGTYGEDGAVPALIESGLESPTDSESHRLAQIAERKTNRGKKLSGYEIRQLVSENQKQITAEILAETKTTAEKRLTELGESQNVSKIAELVAKRATGQEMTRSEISTLARSQYGAQVAKEMRQEVNGTKDFDTVYKSLEDRVDNIYTTSESGQATVHDTNEAIDLSKLEVVDFVKDEKTGKVTDMVIKVDGKEVRASDINFADDSQAYLFSAVQKIENITPGDAQVIIRDYNPASGQTVGEYLNGVDEAFTYGYYNYSEADLKAGNFTGKLTDIQAKSAYMLGQSARKIGVKSEETVYKKMRTAAEAKMTAEQKTAQQKAQIESDDVEVYFEDGGKTVKFDEHTGKYDDKRMAAVNTAKFLSKLGIGGKYYFYESYVKDGVRVYKDANGNEVEAPNGMYKDADGSIHIDLNAGDAGQGTTLFTMGHELGHFVKAQSKRQFKILGDLIAEAFDKTDLSMHERVLAKQKFLEDKRGKAVSYTEAHEEVVCDALSTMLTDGSFYEKIMEIKVKDKGLFNTIKRFFDKMIAKFKKVYEELTPDQRDAQGIREMKDMFDKIQTAFAEALVEASENFQAYRGQKNTAEDGGVAMSIREVVGESGKTYGKGVYLDSNKLTNIPEDQRKAAVIGLFRKLGGKKVVAYDQNGASIEISIAEGSRRYKNSKGKSIPVNNHITSFLNSPVKQEALILADELIAASRFEGQEKAVHAHDWLDNDGKNPWDVWKVFIQEKNNSVWEATLKIANTVDGEKVLYEIYPIEMVEAARKPGTSTTNNKVAQPDAEVKSESAVRKSDRDSNGNQLSKEQQEFFKDSKVRDDNGNLLPVYHGSKNSGFNVFQYSKDVQTGTDYGEAYYFTSDRQKASGYSYDVTKDERVAKYNADRESLKKRFLETHSEEDKNAFLNYRYDGKKLADLIDDETYNTEGGEVKEVYLNLTNPLIVDAGGKYYYEVYQDYFDKARANGNDGIIVKNVIDNPRGDARPIDTYIAFHPEQIKNVDNQNPTTDPDIRYSYRGVNKDGIEVYETSKATMNLTWADRVSQYEKMLSANFVGRTARFKRNGHIYYAQFDPNSAGKVLYGEKGMSKDGKKAIIRAGADGDIFDLVENARYDHSAKDKKNHKAKDGFTDYFDYFYKTVQIDGKVFDININVKKQYGSKHGYTYTIKVADNKTKKASPALAVTQPSKVQGTPSATKITQPTSKVNSQNSGTNSDRGDGTSNRSLLANAFEGITKSSPEYELIQQYKGRIRILNEYEEKLSKLNAEIRKLTFGTEGQRDTQKLKQLQTEAKKVAENINRNDKKLLSLEASEPLRKVIERERKKEAQKTKDHVKELIQNKKDRAEQTELRHKIRKAIRDLDKILNRGNKQRNVKEDLQPVVTKALQAAEILFTDNYGSYDMLRNGLGVDLSDSEEALVESCAKMLKDLDKMPTDGYENWQARQEAENRLRTKMSKLKEVFARERKRLNNTTVSGILGELADAYAGLEESELSYVQGAYSEPVHNFLKNLQSEVGGTIVSDMTKNQLESVYAAYQMVLTTVRKANQMFNEELKQSREQLGNAVIEEVLKAGGVHLLGTKIGDEISQFDWNNMKPVWVANRIGSETFGKLMKGLFKGQYNFAVDIDEAKQFKLNMDEKYHPREWDAEKLYEFESSTGKKFSLNLQQIMSLYAFSKREQAYSHLLSGGFVFEDNSTVVVDGKLGIKRTYIHKGAASYKLNEATLNGIINSLTAEQKAYVDEMQKYLSDVMGAKGNEVSMQLYGIQMFKEKFYFPLRSSGAYMERAKEAEMKKQQGQINLVNSGFTHAVKPQAKNPIILSGFMDVWAEHCNEMSMYHSMVLPMEDFRKVYNYSTVHDEKMESASVYQTIQDAYGKAATNYIDQLYRELNAGATVDPRETPWKTFISNFKKAAVMLSGSVVVQQFSSIGRAYAVIDPKYFAGAKVNSDTQLSTVDEMKKYAPVAIIKEMGGFDTGTKGSAKSYIMAETYGKGERIKGLKKDKQYRGDIMGYLPAKADEITWCSIWEAVKRETKAKNPKMDIKSEEFLKLAGDRFSEAIEKTQVYDSVLARSANMRSKGNFMAMATAFMAEPTTTINLIEDAIRRGDKKYLARTFGAVAVSIVLNNALASIVYAMRDDDEDETFIEKYFQSFTSGMIDDINPMSYYPFLKDIYSLFQGYDVERTDMAVFADVRDALKKAVSLLGKDTSDMDDDKLAEHNKQVNEVFMSILDAGFSAFGVPVKNVRRDGVAIINGIKTIGEDLSGERSTTWNSFWDKVGAAVKDTIPVYAGTKDQAKTDKLYTAIISGDKAYLDRLKSTYKTEDAYQSAVRKALRENDSRIHAAAQAGYEGNSAERNRIYQEIKKEGKFAPNLIIDAINSELNAIRNKLEPDKVTGNYEAYDFVEAVSAGDASTANTVRGDIISTYVANGKTQAEAEKAFVSDVKSSIEEAYSYGALDKATAENILVDYADMDDEDAKDRVTYWDFCKENPNSDLSESKVLKYLEFAEPAAISLDVYKQFVNGTKDLSDIKDEWGDVEVSKRDQIIEVIHALPLTGQQKDALYLAADLPEDKIWDVPW